MTPPSTPAEKVVQGLLMVRGGGRGGAQKEKREILRKLLAQEEPRAALIFCNRKRDVDILQRSLKKHGHNAAALHGDMSQPVRTETMDRFKQGEIILLVCSDVAARGLDLNDLSHVFNFDVPIRAEDYVHRIGRTGRAGREGRAFTLGTSEDAKFIVAIERLIGYPVPRPGLTGAKQEKAPEAAPQTEPQTEPETAPETQVSESETKSEPEAKAPELESKPEFEPESEPKSARKRSRSAKKSSGGENKPREKKPARKKESPEPDGPIIGLGEHVPAFLQRSVKS